MYKTIKEHRSVRKIYTEQLLRKGDIDPQEAEEWLNHYQGKLQEAFDRTKEQEAPHSNRDPLWTDEEITGYQNEPSPDTSITQEVLDKVGAALTSVPEGFTPHPKLKPVLAKRAAMAEGRDPIDWGTAEQLAFGSLLVDGFRVRLSGQDVGRGTFSHRHAIIFDSITGEGYVPLNALAREAKAAPVVDPVVVDNALSQETNEAMGEASFAVYDSLLSEYGVLGFEYGYSVADPGALVEWEAQFGDFMNGSQIIIDQFISSAEEKWGQHSGLVLSLPHGYEGQGPEHSSARLERFLTLCAEGNMQVIYPTTPAQYFHALRRQMKNNPRKPLIVMNPKSLLRHPMAVSGVQDLLNGRFEPVLHDVATSGEVKRVILTSGKVYYDLRQARDKASANVAILRLEQFYPFPEALLVEALKGYPNATEVVWVQEEPRNMGAWPFLHERLQSLLGGGQKLQYVGRPVAAAPATGSHHRHDEQQKALVAMAIG
jgi:multifunctional 2-oxoglutarate metabolism enzyme